MEGIYSRCNKFARELLHVLLYALIEKKANTASRQIFVSTLPLTFISIFLGFTKSQLAPATKIKQLVERYNCVDRSTVHAAHILGNHIDL